MLPEKPERLHALKSQSFTPTAHVPPPGVPVHVPRKQRLPEVAYYKLGRREQFLQGRIQIQKIFLSERKKTCPPQRRKEKIQVEVEEKV
jgi:hypothetical protein